MGKGGSFDCPRCVYFTKIRIEMIAHAIKKHNAVYGLDFITKIQPSNPAQFKLKRELFKLMYDAKNKNR